MTEPTTGNNDDALGAALRGMPRPAVDPVRREAHLAAALSVLDAHAGGPIDDPAVDEGTTMNNVVSLDSRRRYRAMTFAAVAAAGLVVAGIGIGRVSAPDATTPNPAVKNAALTTVAGSGSGPTVVSGCPDLAFDAPATVVTEFGIYVLVRTGSTEAGELIVVDTATCSVVTRAALGATDAG